jgi:protein gp37
MAESSIEWTDATWNPVAGCTILSPGCTNCYAMRMAARLDAMGSEKYAKLTRRSGKRAVWTGRVYLDRAALAGPRSWSKPRMVFVNSMSDLFQDSVPTNFIRDVWDVMQATPRHTYQILTKRPERMAEVANSLPLLSNVWLGVSVESSDYYWRLDELRRVKAAIRFVSFEPLLSSVKKASLKQIDWAIVGGESGPRARPMDPRWVQEIHVACREAGTAFFFKQWGGRNKKRAGRMINDRTWDEFPATPSLAGAPQYSSQPSSPAC